MRPNKEEYGSYYEGYVQKVGPGNIFDILKNQMHETYTLINSLTSKQALYQYAKDKWTVKEVVGHMVDSERIFACRALSIGKGGQQELPGFDQDNYVKAGNFNERSLQSLGDEYFSLRNATIALFESFPEETLSRKGIANNTTFSVRAIAYIIAGHERHHLQILREKYQLSL